MTRAGVAEVVAVFVGGGVGSVARYGVGVWLAGSRPWVAARLDGARLSAVEAELIPLGTLAVNLVGCLAIGLVWGGLGGHAAGMGTGVGAVGAASGSSGGSGDLVRVALMTGLLGGFTTFSAFGLETVRMFAAGSRAEAVVYALVSVLGGVALCGVGWWAGAGVGRWVMGGP